MKVKLILPMGVAGAGKSVQGQLLAKDLGYEWISTGEVLRAEANDEQRQEMLEGKLLNDQEIINLVDRFLDGQRTELDAILDGFPRTLPQAKWLYAQHQADRVDIRAIIHLNVPKSEVVKRLMQRGRPDDTEEVIVRRYNDYLATTEPLISWLESQGITVFEVDGAREIEAIHSEIMGLIQGEV